ncbi:MAG: UDP-3-O-acyl-N-acetylglucosamine deacetylase [Planctomycetaceae bacterium]
MSRLQQTIAQPAALQGIGFLTGADVTMRFRPAPENHGIAFCRVDCAGAPLISACVDNIIPCDRRTVIEKNGVRVELIEHVMAALAGLQIDNCIVELNAPEPPGCDGSSREFAYLLLEAGIVPQNEPRAAYEIGGAVHVRSSDGLSTTDKQILAQPSSRKCLTISYDLDYGAGSLIPRQSLTLNITPQTFVSELAFCRTFVLESEVAALKAQGFGTRVTTQDILVFGERGVVDNELRVVDECVRHKILDCVGDLALVGCDLYGYVSAYRSGHRLNQDLARQLHELRLQSHAEGHSEEHPAHRRNKAA